MIFASFEFIFMFLPIFLACYFTFSNKYQNIIILLFSWLFYAWWRVDFLALLIASTTFTYLIGLAMDRAGRRTVNEWRWMMVGVTGNLGALVYFKYANFIVDNISAVEVRFGFHPVVWNNIILPIGLSFYVMQSISYLLDIRNGTVPVSRSFLNYATYKAIFAQLIAGPIVRYAEVADEMKQRSYSMLQFGLGAESFMIGFAMKVLIADTLSPMVAVIYDKLDNPSFADAWIGGVGYTLQLYFDFAGYSLMAIGLARMIGFHFPENFNNPYLAGSSQEFWQRWHITLSRFLRDYLYFNIGGSRVSPLRTYVNLMIVMTIGGLWHGSNWNFVVWGVWHGCLLCVHRLWTRLPGYRPMPYWCGNILMMLGTIFGRVVFRASDFAIAVKQWEAMFGLYGFGGVSEELAWQMPPEQIWCIPIAIAIVYLPLIRGDRHSVLQPSTRPFSATRLGGVVATAGPLIGYLLSMVLLYSRAAVPFLYFQF